MRLPGEGSALKQEILRVIRLTKHFPLTAGLVFRREVARVHAVDDVSFVLYQGETLGLVGESGCGKSTVARAVLRLVEPTAARVLFGGTDVVGASPKALRELRRDLQIIFQDPFSSLNPRQRVGDIIGEPLVVHRIGDVERRVRQLLDQVGLASGDAGRYPHEFSGGQRQRIAIARALATHPKVIFCDEPTSALDVSIRGQILNLLSRFQRELGLSYVIVSHDLSVVRDVADKVAVMYLGRIVEVAPTEWLYRAPMHPYTVALLSAVPIPDPTVEEQRERIVLRGEIPSPMNPPPACRFHTRCWKAQDICRSVLPPLTEQAPGHWSACHFPESNGTTAFSNRALHGAASSSGAG